MGENWHKLPPSEEAYLVFLRRQVDNLEQLSYSDGAPADTTTRLFYAREDLRAFVEGKRRQGYTI